MFGAPGGARTPGPRLRRPLLYPTELQAQATEQLLLGLWRSTKAPPSLTRTNLITIFRKCQYLFTRFGRKKQRTDERAKRCTAFAAKAGAESFFQKKIVNGIKVCYTPRRVGLPHDQMRPSASKEGFNVKRENCLKAVSAESMEGRILFTEASEPEGCSFSAIFYARD